LEKPPGLASQTECGTGTESINDLFSVLASKAPEFSYNGGIEGYLLRAARDGYNTAANTSKTYVNWAFLNVGSVLKILAGAVALKT
jgi:hypothetical protein